jgi:hypothetical protein
LRVWAKVVLDKGSRWGMRVRSLLGTEILGGFESVLGLFVGRRLGSYFQNIEHYLEFFGAISEEKDFAKMLVGLDLVEIIFRNFSNKGCNKNVNSLFEKISKEKSCKFLVQI